MLIPFGFEQQSVITSLGRMVYYTGSSEWWGTSAQKSLVFFHGFGGGSSAYEWSQVYPAFASEYRILAPDLIGWGRSEHPARNYVPEDYITILIEFLEKTCQGPVPVVASSLTAALTMRAAINRPDLFDCLIVTTPSGLSDFGTNYRNNLLAQIISTPIVDRLLYSAAIATSGGILNFLENRQFANPNRIYPEIVQAYLASAKEPNAEYAALSFVRGDLCFDLALYVPQLTTPTAIIWGEKSQFTSPEIGKRLANLNPQAIRYFHQLENVGLTPQLEIPAVTAGLISKFLKLLSAS